MLWFRSDYDEEGMLSLQYTGVCGYKIHKLTFRCNIGTAGSVLDNVL